MDGIEIMKEIRASSQRLRLSSPVPLLPLAKTSSLPWLKEHFPGRRMVPNQLGWQTWDTANQCGPATHANIKVAAAILDIDRSTLYHKIKKYAIRR
jgi:hypothetical protein